MGKRILVIGAGPSGLMAAGTAAKAGAEVTVLERERKAGKKILVSGNGRCNFTNISRYSDSYRGADPRFPDCALENFLRRI